MTAPASDGVSGRVSGRSLLLERLAAPGPLVTVELRPPASDLGPERSMDAWIDMHHAVGRLSRSERFVFVTDNAVGSAEEENLAHLGANLAEGVDPRRVVPFLTCKHTLDYCLVYAERAAALGFRALTVLGGDRSVGPPRCVPHAWQLRRLIRARVPGLALGGWANPHRDAGEQVGWLAEELARRDAPDGGTADPTPDFFLTQVVSHHSAREVEAFVRELGRRGVGIGGVFGVFLYRSANPATLARLSAFFPVPAAELTREFERGLEPEDVCAASIRALREVGAEKVYVSNLGLARPEWRLRRILERV